MPRIKTLSPFPIWRAPLTLLESEDAFLKKSSVEVISPKCGVSSITVLLSSGSAVIVGAVVGSIVGSTVGSIVGSTVGSTVGSAVGACVCGTMSISLSVLISPEHDTNDITVNAASRSAKTRLMRLDTVETFIQYLLV